MISASSSTTFIVHQLLSAASIAAPTPHAGDEAVAHAGPVFGPGPFYSVLIPLLPLLAAAICGWVATFGRNYDPKRSKWPGYVCVLGIFLAFLTSLGVIIEVGHQTLIAHIFNWIEVGGLNADFSFYLDPLTSVMLLVVTGIATLVALYATEYMAGDRGYARFFSFVSLFVFAMTCLILADNLILLYLGWEGVGLCSYLLIGYYYEKPSAVAAGKKAFIVNRIGDLGFALGIMLTWVVFGSVEYQAIIPAGKALLGELDPGTLGPAALTAYQSAQATLETSRVYIELIPFLLMVGAFGKSAQIPLYVWLPDAMEGPTPVSALIHAATMVTAGVYMIARLIPLFMLSEYALPTVAWIGGLTAFFAATIGMAQYDMKRIFAYSTVSQLGYMFLGLGVLTTTGAVFHLFTHAFFKALLFLGSGAVMHGFAGQLDIRKISGLRKVEGWQVVFWTMLVGCAALAGVPLLSGYFSKDKILAEAFVTEGPGFLFLGILGLLTAFITAYYTFRVFFRVFLGPERYEPGDEHHGIAEERAAADPHRAPDHAEASGHGKEHPHAAGHEQHDHHHGHGFHPHAPGWAINTVLVVLAIGSLFAGALVFVGGDHAGWFGGMIDHSTASIGHAAPHGAAVAEAHGAEAAGGMFSDPHKWMYFASALVGVVGIAIAWFLHLANRPAADRAKHAVGPVARVLERKYFVDELYDRVIVRPLRMLGHVFYVVGDTVIVDGLVSLAGALPRFTGHLVRPLQSGIVHRYGLNMAGGIAVVVILVWVMLMR